MLIIVKEGELTEKKKNEVYKYRGLFKIINRITRLIEELEQLDQYITYGDEERIRRDKVQEINLILDQINKEIEYARKRYKEEIPIALGGDIDRLIKG